MIAIYTTIAAILLFAVLIFVHELGHFAAAKAVGIEVKEFALGMGPAIIKKKKGETLYSLRCLPIGGYCKMDGEDEESESDKAFYRQAPWKRIVVLLAGGIMNLLTGLIVCIVLMSQVSEFVVPQVESVVAGGGAETAGILPGDTIYKVDNTRINTQADVRYGLYKTKDKPVNVTVVRDGEKKTFAVVPQYSETDKQYLLGYRGAVVKNNFWVTIKNGYYDTVFFSKTILETLGGLITGKVSVSNMSGPVGIVSEIGGAVGQAAQSTGEAARLGWLNLWSLFLMITINLGLFNLLPFPALDGGRIVFVIVEAIRKKALSPEKEGIAHLAGFGFLILLIIFVTSQDIWRLFNR